MFKKQKLKNKLFLILTITLMTAVSAPSCFAAADEINEFGTMKPAETRQQPFPFKEKFIFTASAVVASIAVIYLGLLGYKKLAKNKLNENIKVDYSEVLSTPGSVSEAVNVFLDKSRS